MASSLCSWLAKESITPGMALSYFLHFSSCHPATCNLLHQVLSPGPLPLCLCLELGPGWAGCGWAFWGDGFSAHGAPFPAAIRLALGSPSLCQCAGCDPVLCSGASDANCSWLGICDVSGVLTLCGSDTLGQLASVISLSSGRRGKGERKWPFMSGISPSLPSSAFVVPEIYAIK